MSDQLNVLRNAIDEIDDQILELICARQELARKCKPFKPQIIDRDREAQIFARLERKRTRLYGHEIRAVWEQIIALGRKAQQGRRKILDTTPIV